MKRRIFAIIYTAATLLSLVLILIATANYLQFYTAVSSIQVAPEASGAQQIINASQTNTTIVIHLHVSNPTGYTGLNIEWLTIRLFFNTTNGSLFQTLSLFSPNPVYAQIGPSGIIRVTAKFYILGNDAMAFNNYYAKYGNTALANYNVDVHLGTWLEAFSGIDVYRDFQYPLK